MPYSAAHVDALAAEGVDVVINVCEPHEYWEGERAAVEAAFADAGITERWLPVPDGATVPDGVLDAAVAAAQGNVVYVHCRGGRERSAAVAIAIIASADGVSVEDALAVAVARRPIFKPLEWQLAGVRSWLRATTRRRMLDQ